MTLRTAGKVCSEEVEIIKLYRHGRGHCWWATMWQEARTIIIIIQALINWERGSSLSTLAEGKNAIYLLYIDNSVIARMIKIINHPDAGLFCEQASAQGTWF